MKLPKAQQGNRPLYVQVRDLIVAEIQSGAWAPGAVLPSEFELARTYGVSQGTIRKATDALAADQILVRRQGRGTFVHAHTAAEVLFRFFQFREPDGQRVIPASRTLRTTRGSATRIEQDRLALAKGARVIRHSRLRTWRSRPFIFETIVLPEALFPGLAANGDLPNTLYDMFQTHYGVTVARAVERVDTQTASERQARLLDLPAGQPLLRIDRQTIAIDGRIIEWRLSLCHLDGLYYAVEVG